MTKLSVNINKIATLRNARGGNTPNVCQVALDCERFGAQGITVHPRPDERHIRLSDVWDLKPILKTEFNIEGYPSPDFIKLVKSVKPHQVTLVPDPPEAITSNSGWDTVKNLDFLKEIVSDFQSFGIRVSIFVDTKNTGVIPDSAIADMIRKTVDLTPKGIIERLKLRRPIYLKTAAFGHFGRNDKDFTWEHLDLVPVFKNYLNKN